MTGWNDEIFEQTEDSVALFRMLRRARIRNTHTTVTLDDLATFAECGSCEEWHTGVP